MGLINRAREFRPPSVGQFNSPIQFNFIMYMNTIQAYKITNSQLENCKFLILYKLTAVFNKQFLLIFFNLVYFLKNGPIKH